MATLDEWTRQACDALGLDAAAVDTRFILDLARDVAHQVERPAAPVTAYLIGLAVGRGTDPQQAAADVRRLLPPAG
jgi:hypothetical protein